MAQVNEAMQWRSTRESRSFNVPNSSMIGSGGAASKLKSKRETGGFLGGFNNMQSSQNTHDS